MSPSLEVQQWWESLDFLAPDVRQDLGRLIAVLERGLSVTGPARESDQPAGWSGVTHRGPWNRLVPSEWALAEAAPEEFVRRADEGELSFWELAREEGESRHAIWVWVDVGPDQLGACRLVQIAVLLWLQRLAFRSGGMFYWGCIQSPEKAYEGFGAEEFKSFLNSRSLEGPGRTTETFPEFSVWCVGSESWLRQVPKDIRRLALSQIDEATVYLSEGTTRLRLPLPSSPRAVRLLRDPLAWGVERKAAVASAEAEGRMMFSVCGKRLAFVGSEAISTLPLAPSLNSTPGRLRTYPLKFRGAPVVAVSIQDGAISVVQSHLGSWSGYWLNPPRADQNHLVTVESSISVPTRLGTCWRHWPSRWYVWAEETLFHFDEGQAKPLQRLLGGIELGNSSVLVTEQGVLSNTFGQTFYTFEGELPRRVYAAPTYPLTAEGIGQALACLRPDGRWRLSWLDPAVDLRLEGEVLGIVRNQYLHLALLVLREGVLYLHGADRTDAVALDGRVTEAVPHPRGVVAYRTAQGETGVYSFLSRGLLWRARR